MSEPTLTFLLQRFFTERLGRQLGASPQTVTAYRDTIRLLLLFAAQKTKRPPSRLTIDDLDAVTVGEFLTHLDCDRHNSTATRNARLAAIQRYCQILWMSLLRQPAGWLGRRGLVRRVCRL